MREPVFSEDERTFLAALDDDYAWEVAQALTDGGRIVGGTPKAHEAARWIRDQFVERAGLDPRNVVLEEFPVVGYDLNEATAGPSVGDTSLSISTDGVWSPIPCAQVFKGDGTGAAGVAGEIVDVGRGTREDFRSIGGSVRGKIVLFAASDLLFYGAPVQQMAADRGAVAAIAHWPIAPDDALRLHVTAPFLPMVNITNHDAAKIRGLLAKGPVKAKLVIDNRWDGEPKHVGVNVLGSIPGSEFPDEYVYLCAHFDHWFTSATDNNAGVGSLLSIAKAIAASGMEPRRTIVFASFDAEEIGGWADTWYDWLIGAYSHVVRTLDGRELHADRRGKIVAMVNMDVVGTKDAEVSIETTPDITRFIQRAAEDAGLLAAVPARIFWPPTSYDDWPFFQAGVPVSQTAWWGPAYERLYHTTRDTMETLDRRSIHLNSAFNGLAVIRLAQSTVHPYDLDENLVALNEGLQILRSRDPDSRDHVDSSSLEAAIRSYAAHVARLIAAPLREKVDPRILNLRMRQAAAILNPRMFSWDFAAPLPGWAGVSVFTNPANDLRALKDAIAALRLGQVAKAREALEGVATMQWGRHTDYESYRKILGYIHRLPRGRLLWADGFLPPLSDVHREFDALASKPESTPESFLSEIESLEEKVTELYRRLNPIVAELGRAVSDAAAVLEESR